MIDVEQTIISQYANSPTIVQLIKNMNDYIDPRADINKFYDFVWNVDTAQGFGLDIWGRIVNISRQLTIAGEQDYLGFSEAGNSAFGFGQEPFYSGVEPATQTYTLADDAYRALIMVKALTNISQTTAPTMNQLLKNLFPDRGRCYVNDLGNMKFRYTFEFTLTPYELAIITQSGALPKPAGVEVSLFASIFPAFGFLEAGASAYPFGQAPFIAENSNYAFN